VNVYEIGTIPEKTGEKPEEKSETGKNPQWHPAVQSAGNRGVQAANLELIFQNSA